MMREWWTPNKFMFEVSMDKCVFCSKYVKTEYNDRVLRDMPIKIIGGYYDCVKIGKRYICINCLKDLKVAIFSGGDK